MWAGLGLASLCGERQLGMANEKARAASKSVEIAWKFPITEHVYSNICEKNTAPNEHEPSSENLMNPF